MSVAHRTVTFKMATFMLSLMLTLLCGYVFTSSPLFTSYEMTTVCNETVDLSFPQLLRGRVLQNTSVPNLECKVRIQVQPHHRIIISLQFASEFVSGWFCRDDVSSEQIYIADPRSCSRVSAKDRQFCENITAEIDLVSTAENITLHFYSNNTDISGGFQLLLIPFHTGICSSDEHRCSNNRCIEHTLQCRGNYNNCSNDDCGIYQPPVCMCTSPLIGPILIVGVIIVTIVAIIACYCWCLRKKRRSQRQRQLRNSTADRSQETAEDSNTPVEPTRVSMISAPAYTPLCAPPPYSILPAKHIPTTHDVQTTQVKCSKEGDAVSVRSGEPPSPYNK